MFALRLRLVVFAAPAVLLGGVACGAAACGGAEFTAESAEAGPEAGTGVACLTPPAATGDEAQFCADETAIFERCGDCEQCRQTNLNNCIEMGDALSASLKTAIHACGDQIACGDYSTYGSDPCVSAQVAAAGPTTAQTATKETFCASCALKNASGCADYFNVASADGGAAGLGYIVLLSNDAIAKNIATKCSTLCGEDAYEVCALAQFCTTQAQDACNTGYCGK